MKECPCCKSTENKFSVDFKICRKCAKLKAKTRWTRYGYETGSRFSKPNKSLQKGKDPEPKWAEVFLFTCEECKFEYYSTRRGKKYCCGRCRNRNTKRKHKETYRLNNPDKYAAHRALARAIARGTIRRPTVCEECLERKDVHGHHVDYSKKLFVFWLCADCHNTLHKTQDSLLPHWEK